LLLQRPPDRVPLRRGPPHALPPKDRVRMRGATMATSRARAKAQAPGETTTVRGVVESVFFASPKFSAGRLRAADSTVLSFAGEVVVREHQPVVLTGSWERHPKYGRQFKATSLLHDLAPDTDGLALYLANHPDLPGIGP